MRILDMWLQNLSVYCKLERSVSVLLLLVWSSLWHIDVLCLVAGELSELGTKCGQMVCCYLLIKFFWKNIDLSLFIFLVISVIPELNLSEYLVRE